MLSLQESVAIFSQERSRQGDDHLPRHLAVSRYLQARRQGLRRRWLKRLAGKDYRLRDLAADVDPAALKGSHSGGVRSVPIHQIRGSEGRSQDFDADFFPLAAHLDERWIEVAAAALGGVELPPVELIQVGEHYYVRDGHHRISVARSLGQKAVDAQVTVWQVQARNRL